MIFMYILNVWFIRIHICHCKYSFDSPDFLKHSKDTRQWQRIQAKDLVIDWHSETDDIQVAIISIIYTCSLN